MTIEKSAVVLNTLQTRQLQVSDSTQSLVMPPGGSVKWPWEIKKSKHFNIKALISYTSLCCGEYNVTLTSKDLLYELHKQRRNYCLCFHQYSAFDKGKHNFSE